MKKAILATILFLAVAPSTAFAAPVDDWCLNIEGVQADVPSGLGSFLAGYTIGAKRICIPFEWMVSPFDFGENTQAQATESQPVQQIQETNPASVSIPSVVVPTAPTSPTTTQPTSLISSDVVATTVDVTGDIDVIASGEDFRLDVLVISAYGEARERIYPSTDHYISWGYEEYPGWADSRKGTMYFPVFECANMGESFPYPCPGKEIDTQEEYANASSMGYWNAAVRPNGSSGIQFTLSKGVAYSFRFVDFVNIEYLKFTGLSTGKVVELMNL